MVSHEEQTLAPPDGSDCNTLEAAQAAVGTLRGMLCELAWMPPIGFDVAAVPKEPPPFELDRTTTAKGSAEEAERNRCMVKIQQARYKWMCSQPADYVNVLRTEFSDEDIQMCIDRRKPLSFPSIDDYDAFVADLADAASQIEERTGVKDMRFVMQGSSIFGFSVSPTKGAADQPSYLFLPPPKGKSDVDIRVAGAGIRELADKLRESENPPAAHKFNANLLKGADPNDSERLFPELAAVQRKWTERLGGVPVEWTFFAAAEYNYGAKPWDREIFYRGPPSPAATAAAAARPAGHGHGVRPAPLPQSYTGLSLHAVGAVRNRTVESQCEAPLDGTDCTTLESARDAITYLRRALRDFAFIPLTGLRVAEMSKADTTPAPAASAGADEEELAFRGRNLARIQMARFTWVVDNPSAYANILRAGGHSDEAIQLCLDRKLPLNYASEAEYTSFTAALGTLIGALAAKYGISDARVIQEDALGYAASPLAGSSRLEPSAILPPRGRAAADGAPAIGVQLRMKATGLDRLAQEMKDAGSLDKSHFHGFELGYSPSVLKKEFTALVVPELGEFQQAWSATFGAPLSVMLWTRGAYDFEPKQWEREIVV